MQAKDNEQGLTTPNETRLYYTGQQKAIVSVEWSISTSCITLLDMFSLFSDLQIILMKFLLKINLQKLFSPKIQHFTSRSVLTLYYIFTHLCKVIE